MKSQRALLALAITAGLLALSGCKPSDQDAATGTASAPAEDADAFVARVNQTVKEMTPELTAAAWLGARTYVIRYEDLVRNLGDLDGAAHGMLALDVGEVGLLVMADRRPGD